MNSQEWDLARRCYEGYNERRAVPDFADLDQRDQERWRDAAKAVLGLLITRYNL